MFHSNQSGSFWGDAITKKKQRWPTEFLFGTCTTRHWGEHSDQVLKKIWPIVLEEMRQQEMFTDGQLDGQTDAGEFPDRKKSSSGLRPEELMISEPTGGLGAPWSLAPQAYYVLTPVPEILTFRSTHVISHAKKFLITKLLKRLWTTCKKIVCNRKATF